MKASDFTNFLGITNTNRNKPIEPAAPVFNRDDLGPKKVLLSWTSIPEAGTRKIDPRFKRAVLVASVFVVFFLLIMQEFFLILGIASLIFFSTALSKLPKEKVNYEITSHGVQVGNEFYYWDEADAFFFTSNFSGNLLAINLRQGIPGRVHLGLEGVDKDKLMKLLNEHLRFLEVEPTNFVEQAYLWATDKFDFEEKK